MLATLFACGESSQRSMDAFSFIEIGLSYEEIKGHVGEADRDIGSGVYLFQYDLDDGRVITLQFISLDHLTAGYVMDPAVNSKIDQIDLLSHDE